MVGASGFLVQRSSSRPPALKRCEFKHAKMVLRSTRSCFPRMRFSSRRQAAEERRHDSSKHAWSSAVTDADADSDTNANSDTYAYSDADANSDADAYSESSASGQHFSDANFGQQSVVCNLLFERSGSGRVHHQLFLDVRQRGHCFHSQSNGYLFVRGKLHGASYRY